MKVNKIAGFVGSVPAMVFCVDSWMYKSNKG